MSLVTSHLPASRSCSMTDTASSNKGCYMHALKVMQNNMNSQTCCVHQDKSTKCICPSAQPTATS